MFGIFASIAEFERELIRGRLKSGIAAARTRGVRLGRPRVIVDRSQIALLRAEGLSLGEDRFGPWSRRRHRVPDGSGIRQNPHQFTVRKSLDFKRRRHSRRLKNGSRTRTEAMLRERSVPGMPCEVAPGVAETDQAIKHRALVGSAASTT